LKGWCWVGLKTGFDATRQEAGHAVMVRRARRWLGSVTTAAALAGGGPLTQGAGACDRALLPQVYGQAKVSQLEAHAALGEQDVLCDGRHGGKLRATASDIGSVRGKAKL
jgi:hypothetical protein